MVAVPINWLAVLVCGVLAMVLGILWYGPLFGKQWMKLVGMPDDAMEKAKNDPAAKRSMYRGYAVTFVAALVAAFILERGIVFAFGYLANAGGYSGIGAALGAELGAVVGVCAWLGFTVPPTLGMVLWEGKAWKYWYIVAGFWLVFYAISGAILGAWM